jgi:hypothetical protein
MKSRMSARLTAFTVSGWPRPSRKSASSPTALVEDLTVHSLLSCARRVRRNYLLMRARWVALLPLTTGPTTSPLASVFGRDGLCWLVSEPMDAPWTHIGVSQYLVWLFGGFPSKGAHRRSQGSGMADSVPELSPMCS